MGAFDGADDIPMPGTGGGNEDRPFLSKGRRVLEIGKAIQRKGTNKGNARTLDQEMVIVEFDILETIDGEDIGSIGKVIDVLECSGREWKLTTRGGHAVGRIKSLVAAALGVPDAVVTADMLNGLDWDKLKGMRVLGITEDMFDGGFSVTRYEALEA